MKGVVEMELINQLVIHKAFGEGKIVEQDDKYLTIAFNSGNKRFLFPDSFDTFIKAKNPEIADQITEILRKNNVNKELEAAEKILEKEKLRQKELVELKLPTKKRNKSSQKDDPRVNIAFKCNFCDGGKSSEQIGYNGVCSDEIIHNNIMIEHRTWCNSEDCECLHYSRGEISRKELDNICISGGFVCYESQMLRNWRALAGIVQHGDKKGKPMKLNQVQLNSLCVLTTRDTKSSEKDRFIFAVFLVDDIHEGDGNEEGFVSAQSQFRIKLSPDEARSLKFWDYHSNKNRPDRPVWSSGLHRYFEDEQAAQILSEVMRLKKGTSDEELAVRFFEYFCRIKAVDIDNLNDLSGALKR